MAHSCYMGNPGIRVNGERKDSILWDDLRKKACKSVLETNRVYSIFSNQRIKDFITDNYSGITLDENGELKLQELINTNILTFNDKSGLYNIEDSNVTYLANQDFQALLKNANSYKDELIAVCAFNHASPFNNRFFATYNEETGKPELIPLKTNKSAEKVPLQQKLLKQVSRADVNTKLAAFLAMKGFQVKEDSLNQINSGMMHMYSSTDPEAKVVDAATGLKTIALISSGLSETDQTEVLKQVVGEILYVLGQNTPFIERIENQLTQEVLETMEASDKKAAVKKMLADSLCDKYKFQEKVSKWRRVLGGIADGISNLVNSFINFIKRKFQEEDIARINKCIADANEYAYQTVLHETDPIYLIEHEHAVLNQEELFHPLTFEEGKLQDLVKTLNQQAKNLKKINEDIGEELENIVENIEKSRMSIENKHLEKTSTFYAKGIAEIMEAATKQLADLFKEGGMFKQTIDAWNTVIHDSNLIDLDMATMAKTLRSLSIAYETVQSVQQLLRASKDFLSDAANKQVVYNNYSQEVAEVLEHSLNYINQMMVQTQLGSLIETARMQFVLKFLEGQLGSTYINRTAHKIWHPHKDKNARFKFRLFDYIQATPTKLNAERLPVDEQGRIVNSIDSLIQNVSGPMGVAQRFFFSAGNSGDIILQTMELVSKNQKQVRNRMAYNYRIKLVELRDEALKLGLYNKEKGQYNMAKLYETYPDSDEKTGNLLSDLNWGEWERDQAIFLRDLKEKFLQSPMADTNDKVLKNIRWKAYREVELHKWHTSNSVLNSETNTYRPKKYKDKANGIFSKYYNPKYNELSQQEKQFLAKIMAIKLDIDTNHLPKGATVAVRAPQFRGDFTDRRIGRKQDSHKQSVWSTIWSEGKKIAADFSREAIWDDYGSDIQYDEARESDSFYESDVAKLERIPLYGINKRMKPVTDENGKTLMVTDMSELSTDIIGSLYAYAMMATQYSSLNAVVDSFELTMDQMNSRKVGDVTEETQATHRASSSNKQRMAHFMERHIYGKNYQHMKSKTALKALKTANSVGSITALGFNWLGGTVNRRTGVKEMEIEAASGEYFNMTDLTKARAHWMFNYNSFFKNPLTRQSMSGQDSKVAAIVAYFDVHNKLFEDSTRWNTRKRRFLDISLGEMAMYPYASGEAFMQAVTFMACLEHIKVWKKKNGKYVRMSLYEAYDKQTISKNGDCMLTLGGDPVYQDFDGNPAKQEKAMKDAPKLQELLNLRKSYDEEKATAKANNEEFSTTFQKYINVKNPELLTVLEEYKIQTEIKRPNNITIPVTTTSFNAQVNAALQQYIVDYDYEMKLRAKMQEVSNRCHGVYNNEDAVEASDYLLGKLALTMKGWAIGQATKMFKPHSYSTIFDREDEGYVWTYFKNLLSFNTTATQQNRWHLRDNDPEMTAIQEYLGKAALISNAVSPLTGVFSNYLPLLGIINILLPDSFYHKWGFEDYEIANFRRMHAKVVMMKLSKLIAQFMYYMWKSIPDDDDDEEESKKAKKVKSERDKLISEALKTTSRFNPLYCAEMLRFEKIRLEKTLWGVGSYISLRTWHEQNGLNPTTLGGQSSWESLITVLPIASTVLADLGDGIVRVVRSEFDGNSPEELEFYTQANYQKALDELKQGETDPMTGFTKADYTQSHRKYDYLQKEYNRIIMKEKYDVDLKQDFDKCLKAYIKCPTDKSLSQNPAFVKFADRFLQKPETKESIQKYYIFEEKELLYNQRHDLLKSLYYVNNGGDSENVKGFKYQRKYQSKGRTKIIQKSPLRTLRQVGDIDRTYTNYRKFTENSEKSLDNSFIDPNANAPFDRWVYERLH